MKRIAIRSLIVLCALALIAAGVLYWGMAVFSVTIENQSRQRLESITVNLGGHVMHMDPVSPGERSTIHGTAKNEGAGDVSFQLGRRNVRCSLGYVTTGGAENYILTIQPSQKIVLTVGTFTTDGRCR